MERIFHDSFFLIIIKTRRQDIPRMIIHRRRQVRLDFGSVFTNGKLWSILNVSLYQHHTVWLTKTFGRTFACIPVHFHMFCAKTALIKIPFQRRTFQHTGCHMTFHFQNQNDLRNRTLRYFFSELDRLLYKKIKIFRQPL